MRAALALCFFAMMLQQACIGAEKQYVIKRGDTLYEIAREHGISVGALAERNGLSKSAHVYAGKRLVIPGQPEPAKPPVPDTRQAAIGLSSSLRKAIYEAPVRPGRWKYIVIHHSGVQIGSPKSMDRYHREERHMENGLAYHFVIGNGNGMRDGEVSAGRRWTKQLDGGHLASEAQNKVAIGICLVGNFDRQKATAKQTQSLGALVKVLMDRCKLSASAVKTHQEINVVGTRCPGKNFSGKAFRESLKTR